MEYKQKIRYQGVILKEFSLKELKIELTDACNLCCKHCSSLAKRIASKNIPYSKVLDIVNEAIAMGVKEIKFSGGEPLLWKGLEKVIRIISRNNIKVCIYTTGNIDQFNTTIENFKENGLDRVIFSLFSAKKDSHEKITKKEGSYNNTISAIEKCVELGIKTEIHFVPMASNYKELPQIAWLGKRLNVTNISILRLVPQGRAKSQKDEILSKEQNKELRNIIVTLRNDGYNIRVGSPYNFLNLPDSKPCNSGTEELTIRPNLTICPCDAFKGVKPSDLGIDDKYYSLEKHSLKECWEKSFFLNYIRSFSTDQCYKQCNNFENCNCGCLGQKYYSSGTLNNIPDPMCLNIK